MSATLVPLTRDFLHWVAASPRSYAEVMETWRTSCPRLTVWEDAVDDGLVTIAARNDGLRVLVSDRGIAFLAAASA
jgi:hypothetical protein